MQCLYDAKEGKEKLHLAARRTESMEYGYNKVKDTDAYLGRLEFEWNGECSLENLSALILAHQTHVVFENCDPFELDKTCNLDSDYLFDKVINRKRGGYCFELNKLFLELLLALGYEAYACPCRVVMNIDEIRPIMHRGTIVVIDGQKIFADVGFGGPMPPGAIRISKDRQTVEGETFWFDDTRAVPGWHELWRVTSDGSEQAVLLLNDALYLESDFAPLNLACSDGPNAIFKRIRNVNLRTKDGFVAIRDNLFKNKKGDFYEEREIDGSEVRKLYREYFGIEL